MTTFARRWSAFVMTVAVCLAWASPSWADQVVSGSRLMGTAETFVRSAFKCPGAHAVGQVPDQRVEAGKVQLAASWPSGVPAADASRVFVRIETRVDGTPVSRVAILVEVERQSGRPAGSADGRSGATGPGQAAPASRAVTSGSPPPPVPPQPPMAPAGVRAGDTVTLILRASSGALELQIPARACVNAPLGGTVRVQLEGTNRNVNARVISDHQVESELP